MTPTNLPPPRPVQILLVEDNPGDVDLTREALDSWKILNRLHVAQDGVEAMAFLRREGKYSDAPRPDLILLDLNLPRKDGREVLAEIKFDRYLKSIPIIVLSTSDADVDIVKSYGLGANCYVVKPIGIDRFLAVIQSLGDFWFSLVRLPSKSLLEEYRDTLAAPAPSLTPSFEHRKDRLQLLLIEDNPADADYIRELLLDQDAPSFDIAWVDRLSAALGRLETGSFDVALVDLSLPDSQGNETYSRLAKAFPHLPIVISTGLEDRDTALRAIRSGAEDFIQKKDLDGRLLSRVLQYAIERKWSDEERRTLLLREQAARATAEKAILARDEFLSIASHELKTPVTTLVMQSQLLARLMRENCQGLGEREKTLIEGLEGQTARLIKLVDNLLDVSRIHADRLNLEFTELDLTALISEIADRFRPQLEAAGCELRLNGAPGILGRWDRIRIDQVVTNLVSNAIKFGAGKPVEIEVARHGEGARIAVRDHGIGLKREDLPKLFSRFQRMVRTSEYSGLGLGLYITRQIIEAHHGTIQVQSEPGQGTTFTVDLPLRSDQAAAAAA